MRCLRPLRLTLLLSGILLLAGRVNAQQEVDYEKTIKDQVRKLEADLNKIRNPARRKATEGLIERVKQGRFPVTKINPEDRWNLIDVQVLPEGGGKTIHKENESNIRDPFTYEMNITYSASEEGYVRAFEKIYQVRDPDTGKMAPLRVTGRFEVTIGEMPKSLKPGELFEFTITTRNTRTREGPQSNAPSANMRSTPKVIVSQGRTIVKDWNEILKTPVHHDKDGKPQRKNFSSLTQDIVDTPDELVRKTTYRVKFPEYNPPVYFRIGIDAGFKRDFSDRTRVEYVYLHNGKGVPDAEIQFLDANPMFFSGTSPENLKTTQLVRADKKRRGTTADGVSQLIVRAKLTTDRDVVFKLNDPEDGTLTPLLGGNTIFYEDNHYAFALYTPPEAYGSGPMKEKPEDIFDPGAQPTHRLENILEYRPVGLTVNLSGGKKVTDARFKLARPPVVLVHGFLSDAYNCWVNTKTDGTRMTGMLERAGFMPFLVNYQNTNGTPLKAGDNSSFEDNSHVVWDRADEMAFEPYYDGWIIEDEEDAEDGNGAQTSWLTNPVDDTPQLIAFREAPSYRLGGIKQALVHYRDKLGLAATQADVIGHSMGGLLTRVYASEAYNGDYRRPENFNQGDVHRLITLNTPHHGSELAHLYEALTKAYIAKETWTSWGIRMVPSTFAWLGGVKTPAGQDLEAPVTAGDIKTSALGRIGKTEIPAYAIATISSKNNEDTDEFDEHLIYRKAFGTLGMVFFYNRPLLNDFMATRFNQWQAAPEHLKKAAADGVSDTIDPNDPESFEDYRNAFQMGMDANIYYWEARREVGYQKQRIAQMEATKVVPFGTFENDRDSTYFDAFASTASETLIGGDITKFKELSQEQDLPHTVVAQIQELVFHNDPNNDGAVRLVSQLGSLDKAHTHTIKGVLHSFSPWHTDVQTRVIEVLKWDDADFDRNGFGPAGQLTERYLPTKRFYESRVLGEKAIRWSGMVPSHAQAYAEVADEKDAFILVRPVNRDSTKLIAAGNATKAMAVKGKSSNWGPQKGFIPVEQRYCKLWQVHKDNPDVRKTKIDEFNNITQDMLKKKHPVFTDRYYAIPENLVVKIDGVTYEVLTNPGEPDAEKSIYLYREYTEDAQRYREFKDWQTMQTVEVKPDLAETLRANPMQVLADGINDHHPPLYITADYDLLAIGFYEGKGKVQPGPPGILEEEGEVEFDPLMGFILPDQRKLVDRLNEHVEERTGYKGGKVTHHGPEVQYGGSEYVDYPILVIDPGEPKVKNDYEIYIIRQGPAGFRDIHLKRFFTEQIVDGFHLWPNPDSDGWLWEAYRDFDPELGYDPRDAPQLMKYVAEQTDPDGEPQVDDTQPKDPDDGVPPDVEQLDERELKQLEQSAKSGDVDAQLDLAKQYLLFGKDENDRTIYRSWLEIAARSGRSDAVTQYGIELLEGHGGDTNLPEARRLFEQAIEKDGNSKAHYFLGSMLEYGEGSEVNLDQALQHYYQAAKEGNKEACYTMGDWTYYGKHVEVNKQDAFTWYSIAAEEGLAQAHTALGKFYLYGTLGEQDTEKAQEHFEQAIRMGDSDARSLLLEAAK